MKLFLPVIMVQRDHGIRGTDRYRVTLFGGGDTSVEYTTAEQPLIGQKMVVTIEPEK